QEIADNRPPNATKILPPGQEPVQSQTEPSREQKVITRRPFAGLQPAHGFQQTSSFQPPSTGRQETSRATRNSTVNGSNNKPRWGQPPPIQGKSTSQTLLTKEMPL